MVAMREKRKRSETPVRDVVWTVSNAVKKIHGGKYLID
jgi:hypothetical protein